MNFENLEAIAVKIKNTIQSFHPEEYLVEIISSSKTKIESTKEDILSAFNENLTAKIYIRKDNKNIITSLPALKFDEEIKEIIGNLKYLPESEKLPMKKISSKGYCKGGFSYSYDYMKQNIQKIKEVINPFFFDGLFFSSMEKKSIIFHDNAMNYQKKSSMTSLFLGLFSKNNEITNVRYLYCPLEPTMDIYEKIEKEKNILCQLKENIEIKNSNYDIIFEHSPLEELILNILEGLFAKNLFNKNTIFDSLLEKEIGNSQLNIIECPKNTFNNNLFDYFGHSLKDNPLIEQGILKRFMIDEFYGAKINKLSTGNSGFLDTTYSNIKIIPYESYDETIKSFSGLMISQMINLDVDQTAGTISTVIEGIFYEKGKIKGSFNNCVLSINILDFLKKIIILDNIEESYNFSSGSALLRDIKISGS